MMLRRRSLLFCLVVAGILVASSFFTPSGLKRAQTFRNLDKQRSDGVPAKVGREDVIVPGPAGKSLGASLVTALAVLQIAVGTTSQAAEAADKSSDDLYQSVLSRLEEKSTGASKAAAVGPGAGGRGVTGKVAVAAPKATPAVKTDAVKLADLLPSFPEPSSAPVGGGSSPEPSAAPLAPAPADSSAASGLQQVLADIGKGMTESSQGFPSAPALPPLTPPPELASLADLGKSVLDNLPTGVELPTFTPPPEASSLADAGKKLVDSLGKDLPALPAISEFKFSQPELSGLTFSGFKIPKNSALLTTTVRNLSPAPEAASAEGAPGADTLEVIEEAVTTALPAATAQVAELNAKLISEVISSLRGSFEGLSDSAKFFAGLTGLGVVVALVDSVMYGADLRKLSDEQRVEIANLSEKLEEAKAAIAPHMAQLQVEAESLEAGMAELQASVAAKAQEVESLRASLDALSKKQAAATANDAMVASLRAEVENLQGKLAAVSSGSSSTAAEATTVAQRTRVDVSEASAAAEKSQVAALQAREKALLDALKKFIVEQELLPPGMANMMLATTAPQTLEELASKHKLNTGSSQIKVLEDKVQEMETLLAASRAAEQAASSKLKLLETEVAQQGSGGRNGAKAKSEVDMQKYVAQLTAEVDDLKQKLLESDEKLFDMRQDMQSKLDAAKSMAKELNARLMEKSAVVDSTRSTDTKISAKESKSATSPLEEETSNVPQKTAATASGESSAAPAKVTKPTASKASKTAPKAKQSSATISREKLAELKAMKAYQLRKMSKQDIVSVLIELGVKEGEGGAQLGDMLKTALADLLEATLANF